MNILDKLAHIGLEGWNADEPTLASFAPYPVGEAESAARAVRKGDSPERLLAALAASSGRPLTHPVLEQLDCRLVEYSTNPTLLALSVPPNHRPEVPGAFGCVDGRDGAFAVLLRSDRPGTNAILLESDLAIIVDVTGGGTLPGIGVALRPVPSPRLPPRPDLSQFGTRSQRLARQAEALVPDGLQALASLAVVDALHPEREREQAEAMVRAATTRAGVEPSALSLEPVCAWLASLHGQVGPLLDREDSESADQRVRLMEQRAVLYCFEHVLATEEFGATVAPLDADRFRELLSWFDGEAARVFASCEPVPEALRSPLLLRAASCAGRRGVRGWWLAEFLDGVHRELDAPRLA